MAFEVNGEVVAPARFSEYAVADRNGAWIVSPIPPDKRDAVLMWMSEQDDPYDPKV